MSSREEEREIGRVKLSIIDLETVRMRLREINAAHENITHCAVMLKDWVTQTYGHMDYVRTVVRLQDRIRPVINFTEPSTAFIHEVCKK